MDRSRAVKELLSRHSQLEQSETKAQLSLVTILFLTQITELKLLLEIDHQGNRFYAMILTMLIVSICIEVFVGIIVLYIGNLHYYQPSDGTKGVCGRMFNCIFRHRSRGRRLPHDSPVFSLSPSSSSSAAIPGRGPQSFSLRNTDESPYQRVPTSRSADTAFHDRDDPRITDQSIMAHEQSTHFGASGVAPEPESAFECLAFLDKADYSARDARMRSADACVAISTASAYVKTVDEATRRCPGSSELREELVRAQKTLSSALKEKAKADADQRVLDARLNRALCLKDIFEDEHERKTFQKLSFWQHLTTYLLYFVMLLNIFIATFGISSGSPAADPEEVIASTPTASNPPFSTFSTGSLSTWFVSTPQTASSL